MKNLIILFVGLLLNNFSTSYALTKTYTFNDDSNRQFKFQVSDTEIKIPAYSVKADAHSLNNYKIEKGKTVIWSQYTMEVIPRTVGTRTSVDSLTNCLTVHSKGVLFIPSRHTVGTERAIEFCDDKIKLHYEDYTLNRDTGENLTGTRYIAPVKIVKVPDLERGSLEYILGFLGI